MPTSFEDLVRAPLWLALGETTLRVLLTIGLAVVVLGLIARIKRRWVTRAQAEAVHTAHRQRVLTLSDLLGSVARYAVWTVATVMVLSDVGFEVGPLLASAGIAGLAIGFGAQTLVKDVISGFFLLFDNTLGYGDLITFNGQTATVEYVGLRLIKARKFDGELLMIPAGEIRVFGNKSLGFARVIVDVGLSYEQDVGEALRALEDVAEEWAATEAAKAVLIDETPEVQGVVALADSSVQARILVKVRPGAQFAAERELRRLVKDRFDERGLTIPFPARTVYVRTEPGQPAPGPTSAAAGGA
jgi:small-conductance mechanosensitive channel